MKMWLGRRVLYMKINTLFFCRMSLMSSQNEKCGRQRIEKIKTLILCSSFCPKSCCRLWGNVGNVVEPDRPQMTIRYNMAHAHCMLDT